MLRDMHAAQFGHGCSPRDAASTIRWVGLVPFIPLTPSSGDPSDTSPNLTMAEVGFIRIRAGKEQIWRLCRTVHYVGHIGNVEVEFVASL